MTDIKLLVFVVVSMSILYTAIIIALNKIFSRLENITKIIQKLKDNYTEKN